MRVAGFGGTRRAINGGADPRSRVAAPVEVLDKRRVHFALASDVVNVASRLETPTRTHRFDVIASDATIEAARDGGAYVTGVFELPAQAIQRRGRPLGIRSRRQRKFNQNARG